MRKQARTTVSYRPLSEELEKLTGASSLSCAGQLAAAIGIGEQEKIIPSGELSEHATNSLPPSPPIETIQVAVKPAERSADRVAAGPQFKPTSLQVNLRSLYMAPPIRPLSLPPNNLVTLSSVAPASQPTNAMPIDNGTSGSGTASAGKLVGFAPPTAPSAFESSPSEPSIFSVVVPVQSGPGEPGNLENFGKANSANVANAGVISDKIKEMTARPDNHSRGMEKYIASGNANQSYALPDSYPTSGGGSGTGSTSGSSASGSIAGSSSNANAVTSTPGNWSIQPPAQSGGGTPSPITGQLLLPPSGGGYVGGKATFAVSASSGSSQVKITNVTWSVSDVKAYQSGSQVLPTATTPKKFEQSQYQPPAPDPNNNTLTSFNWGETPGVAKITATATITIGSYPSTTATATCSVPVDEPRVPWKINWDQNANVGLRTPPNGSESTYLGLGTGPGNNMPGMKWSYGPPSVGTLNVEQLVTASSFSITYASGTVTGPKNSSGASPSFPMIDGSKSAIPWYTANAASGTDSPGVQVAKDDGSYMNPHQTKATSASLNDSFDDYIMFNPAPGGGGIWVPVAKFSWTVNISATPSTSSNVTMTSPVYSNNPTDYHTFPPAYASIASDYQGF